MLYFKTTCNMLIRSSCAVTAYQYFSQCHSAPSIFVHLDLRLSHQCILGNYRHLLYFASHPGRHVQEYQQCVCRVAYPRLPSFPKRWNERERSQPRYTGNNNSIITCLQESSNIPVWDMTKVTHGSSHQANTVPGGMMVQSVRGKNQGANQRWLIVTRTHFQMVWPELCSSVSKEKSH